MNKLMQPLKIIFSLLLLFTIRLSAEAQNFELISPDKKIIVTIKNEKNIIYSIAYNGKTVVFDSPLGFEFKNEPAMQSGFAVMTSKLQTIKEEWRPVVPSKHALVTNNCNELELTLKETSALRRQMDICFRVYNDGVAFRYKLYRSEKIGSRSIIKELTGFRVNNDLKAWIAQYKNYTSSHESEFLPASLKSISPKTIADLPFLIEADKNTYMAITEANVDNYANFYIGAADTGELNNMITLGVKLSPLPGEIEEGVKVRFDDTLHTPWRVIMLANTPGKLIESEIIQNLNKPCVIKDPSWIKPGMSAWDNWWSGDVKMDMETIKQYIDLASAEGWPYMLIDWQWYGPFNKPEADIMKPAPQLNMQKILQYAKSKNVRCWLWLYSSDVNRNNNFEKAFALYEKWGIAGVKIDFMDRDDQEMVNWYHQIIKKAADHHLMLDFHGAYKPDGISRTYPNMITREGVMGEEYAKFSNRVTPEHNVTLPFTRMLAGQMDYTPGGFLNVTKGNFKMQSPTEVMNTRCAELAKFVIYESPFTVYCDAPDHILGKPGADFLKNIPTVWSDTKVLDGYPGKYVIIAKKSKNTWIVGAMNNSEARELTIQLDFLSEGKYQVQIWADAKDANSNPENLNKTEMILTNKSRISIKMAIGGGWVAKFNRIN